MAKVDFAKIRIVGIRTLYQDFLKYLQEQENLHIIAQDKATSVARAPHQKQLLELSRIEFVLRFLEPMAPKKGKLQNLLNGGKIILTDQERITRTESFESKATAIIEACEALETQQVRLRNEALKIPQQKAFLQPFLNFKSRLRQNFTTQNTKTFIGTVPQKQEKQFLKTIGGSSHLLDLEIFNRGKEEAYLRLTVPNEGQKKIETLLRSFGVSLIDPNQAFAAYEGFTAREMSQKLKVEAKAIEVEQTQINAAIKKQALSLDDFKILYDVLASQEVRGKVREDIFVSQKTFGIEAWIAKENRRSFEDQLAQKFGKALVVENLEIAESEAAPTKLRNKKGISSFEFVTNMYGIPSKIDIDPTALVAPFFMIAFGLCLSDVGYGLLMTLLATFFYVFGRFEKAAKEGILLLILCGICAILGGVILGGYFGMTPEQAPQFLVKGDAFRGQLLNLTSGNGPIIFLGSVFALGLVQILIGFIADAVRRVALKDYIGAIVDSGAWFFFLISLVLLGAGSHIGMPEGLANKMTIFGAVILVLTQGRSQKGLVGKFFVGILSLYNVVNYFSDLLSYARVMALGLATGVVASVMNTIGIQFFHMISETSFVIALVVGIAVILFGHTLNFLLSLLGAFIHTGRLQFVEFFGKFYEGGGYLFSPFKKIKKYTQTVGD